MLQENTPSYYANIPADVRYSKELCDGAKLLYGEITALASKEGYSWASNSYFSKVYDRDINTVSRWIKELTEARFIRVVIDQKAGNIRRIYLSPKIELPIYKNEDTPIPKIREYNNIKKNIKKNVVTSTDLEKDIKERKTKFFNSVSSYQKTSSKYPSLVYKKFFDYWTEKNQLEEGNKMRFENEKFFEIGRRLATFWSRIKENERSEMWKMEEQSTQTQPDLFTDLAKSKSFN